MPCNKANIFTVQGIQLCASLSFGELLIPCCWAITHSDTGSCCSPFRCFTNAFLREAGYMFSERLQMFPWWPHSCKLQHFTISVGDFSSLHLSNGKHHKPHWWVTRCLHFCVRKQQGGSRAAGALGTPLGGSNSWRVKTLYLVPFPSILPSSASTCGGQGPHSSTGLFYSTAQICMTEWKDFSNWSLKRFSSGGTCSDKSSVLTSRSWGVTKWKPSCNRSLNLINIQP